MNLHPSLSRRTPWLAVAPLLAVAGGCQSYSARPIDPAAHHAAFLDRTPESAEVAAFAARLARDDAHPSGPFDPSDGLSLSEAEAVALVYNGELRLARLRAGVSAAGAQYAGLWEDPVLGTDITRIIQSTEHPWKVFATVGFTIPLSGRLEIEKKRASEAHRADVVRAWAQEWTTRVELRRRWIEWSSARERADVTRQLLGRLDEIAGIVDRMAQAGEMSRVEARLFEVERVTRAAELGALDAEAARAELAVKSLLGLAPTANVTLVPTLNVGAGGGVGGAGADPSEPRDSNVQLAVARAEYEVAERTLELEIRRQYPDLTIGPGYGNEDGDDQFLLGVSLPLPILNRNRQAIATATAEREVSRATYETTYEQVVNNLAGAALTLRSASQQRETLETRVVPLVDEQYADMRRIAELGEISTIVLLESLTRQQEAKLRLIDARAAESLARIGIDELVGPPIEAPIDAPAETPVEPDLNEGANR